MSAPFTIEPFAFNVGPLPLTGFGLAVLLAFGIANIILHRELADRGHVAEAEGAADVTTAALLGTLIGGKLYYVILSGQSPFSRAGFVFWGGFMGAVLFCYIAIKRKKLSFVRFSDVAGIAIAAGYAVGRTGCWAVGDDYGKPWNGPLAVMFPNGAPATTAETMVQQFHAQIPAGTPPYALVAVHPTQLYETALGGVMFAILWRFRKHGHQEGWLFGMYCVLAGIERFIIEFFRAKDDRFALPLSTAQFVALGIALFGAVWMWMRRAPAGTRGTFASASAA